MICIQYKVLVTVFKVYHSGTPQYLADLIKKHSPVRKLRSSHNSNLLREPKHTEKSLDPSLSLLQDHVSSDAWSVRQQRQLSAIAEAGVSVQYLLGNMNPVADSLSLSRIIIGNVQPGINYRLMAEQQEAVDQETKAYRDLVTNLQWADVDISGVILLCDTSTGRPCPLVSLESRRAVVGIIHSLLHPSIRSTVKLVKQQLVWNKMATSIKEWINACLQCQACKVQRHTKAPIDNIPMPTCRFSHIHVDIVRPLPPSNQMRYYNIVTDRSTRWLKATSMSDATTETCVLALLHHWVSRGLAYQSI